MGKWLIGLLGLLVGLGIAFYVDRLRFARGCGPERRERSRWLHYWFTGRFPTDAEEEEEERECREHEAERRRKDAGKGR